MPSEHQAMTNLGQPALDYVRTCVSAGESIIAQQASLVSEGGFVWAYLPGDFSNAASANPEWSLSSAIPSYEGRGDSDLLMGEYILGYLRGGRGRYAIVQDWNAFPDDRMPAEYRDHCFTFKSEVYHFIHSTEIGLTPEGVIDIMRRGYTANSRLNSGILTSVHDIPVIMPGQEITPDIRDALALGVEHIVVDGFDGDREIVWSKRNPNHPGWIRESRT